MKNCAPPPEPARPTSGLPGKLAVRPTVAPTADPFTDPHVAISDVYGYSYKWVDYDEGCLPGTNRVTTDLGNVALAGAAATNAVTQSMLNNVVDPTWLKPLDQPLTQATEAVKNGFYGPWFTVILLLVAAMILVAAARADVSGAVTSAGWALIVLVGTTFLMSYPVTSAQAIDGLIGETVTASARAAGTALTPTTATPATPATPAWLSVSAVITPATCEPCPSRSWGGVPCPSLVHEPSATRLQPIDRMCEASSGWFRSTPESSTATTTLALPVAISHANGACIISSAHWRGYSESSGTTSE